MPFARVDISTRCFSRRLKTNRLGIDLPINLKHLFLCDDDFKGPTVACFTKVCDRDHILYREEILIQNGDLSLPDLASALPFDARLCRILFLHFRGALILGDRAVA